MLNINFKNIYANPKDRRKFMNTIEAKDAVLDYEIKFQHKDGRQMVSEAARTIC